MSTSTGAEGMCCAPCPLPSTVCSPFELLGYYANLFSIVAPFPSAQLPPAASTTFTVRFLPTAESGTGMRTAALNIPNNDSNESEYHFEITAFAGAAAEMNVRKPSVVITDGSGSFSTYNGIDRRCFARLNSDGSLDSTFLDTGSGAAGTVYAIAVQLDGRIVIGGGFSHYNDIQPGKVARVWPD